MRKCIYKKIHFLTVDHGSHKTLPSTQPLHHVIYAPGKFKVAMLNDLGEDAFTRKCII